MTEVTIVSVEQFAYSEFLMSLPDPTAFYARGPEPFDGSARSRSTRRSRSRWSIACSAAPATRRARNRALTEIEQNVVDSVVKLLLDNLTETWKPVAEHGVPHPGRARRGRRCCRSPRRTRSSSCWCSTSASATRAAWSISASRPRRSKPVGEAFAQGWQRTRRQPTPTRRAWLHANLGRVPLPVTARARDHAVGARAHRAEAWRRAVARPCRCAAGRRARRLRFAASAGA